MQIRKQIRREYSYKTLPVYKNGSSSLLVGTPTYTTKFLAFK